MNNIEIKRCPFCGGAARIITTVLNHEPWAYVQCNHCKAATRSFIDKDHDGDFIFDAAEAWNRRMAE